MAIKIKTLTGLVNAALHIKTAGGIAPVNLHAKTADGIVLLSGGPTAYTGPTLRIPGEAIFENITSSADHGAIFGGGHSVAYPVVDGVQTIAVTTPVGASATLNMKAFSKTVPNGAITIPIYIPDISKFNGVQIDISTDSGFATKAYRVAVNQGSLAGWSGWHNVVIDPPAQVVGGVDYTSLSGATSQRKWAVIAGAPSFDTDVFTHMRFGIGPQSGHACTFHIAGAYIGERNNIGNICITIDDGYSEVFEHAKPILEAYGLRSSNSIMANNAGLGGYMTLAQLHALRDSGHECIVHGAAALSTLTKDVATIQAEVAIHQNWIINNGLNVNDSAYVYVYPTEAYSHGSGATRDTSVISQALDNLGIIGARAGDTSGLLFNRFQKAQRRYIAGVGHRYQQGTDDSANTARVILRIQQACALGRGAVLSFHKIHPTPPTNDTLFISSANFEAICAAIRAEIDAGRARNVLFSTLCKDLAAFSD
jgi:peptidoglycan/xylan/chitin deacetylase (PgdA/CDA1 family)